jgi:two-component system sensor histidine kinase TctE
MKLFQREQRSLFGEILDWMLTPLLLLWPVSLVLTWLVAQGIAGKPFDRALEYNVAGAGATADRQAEQPRAVQSCPCPRSELLRADDSDTRLLPDPRVRAVNSSAASVTVPAAAGRGKAVRNRAKCDLRDDEVARALTCKCSITCGCKLDLPGRPDRR